MKTPPPPGQTYFSHELRGWSFGVKMNLVQGFWSQKPLGIAFVRKQFGLI